MDLLRRTLIGAALLAVPLAGFVAQTMTDAPGGPDVPAGDPLVIMVDPGPTAAATSTPIGGTGPDTDAGTDPSTAPDTDPGTDPVAAPSAAPSSEPVRVAPEVTRQPVPPPADTGGGGAGNGDGDDDDDDDGDGDDGDGDDGDGAQDDDGDDESDDG